jgi:hypothetical protein
LTSRHQAQESTPIVHIPVDFAPETIVSNVPFILPKEVPLQIGTSELNARLVVKPVDAESSKPAQPSVASEGPPFIPYEISTTKSFKTAKDIENLSPTVRPATPLALPDISEDIHFEGLEDNIAEIIDVVPAVNPPPSVPSIPTGILIQLEGTSNVIEVRPDVGLAVDPPPSVPSAPSGIQLESMSNIVEVPDVGPAVNPPPSEKRPRPDSMQSQVENDRPLGFNRRQSRGFQDLIEKVPVSKSAFRRLASADEDPFPPPPPPPKVLHTGHLPTPSSSASPGRPWLVSKRLHGPRLIGHDAMKRQRRKTVTFDETCDVLTFERDDSLEDEELFSDDNDGEYDYDKTGDDEVPVTALTGIEANDSITGLADSMI